MNFKKLTFFSLIFIVFVLKEACSQESERIYLSGTGSDHTVNWQFFCTEGRNSGKWTIIPVPSNWELQGFGKYNYGLDKDSLRGKEQGLYKYNFNVPANWLGKQVDIVFEGSMTDTEVKINGKSAGAIHQGSFYRFTYTISNLLIYGKKNLLEVTVSKQSANESVNKAERKCDFWIFGGIFRPVYLEVLPSKNIAHVSIDASSTGELNFKIATTNSINTDKLRIQVLNIKNEIVGDATFNAGDENICSGLLRVNSPQLWTPESPNLYQLRVQLVSDGKIVHQVQQRFGFRTVELRQRDGFYVNGVKIKFKGVNRHTFWPATGRATNKSLSIADVSLIKEMNMNAVRMSHYPPDEHFLDACDSLGLFVLDELTGWHNAYDTPVGTKLVKEMIARDINHPCVVAWDNGNEGGHNFDLDPVFDTEDLQKRPVIHPWQNFRGMDTQHYINYNYGNGNYFQGHEVFFPTEFLHGLFDGGLGAGLSDYWEAMWQNPLSAGGFLWVFADEGVVRTDKNGSIDTDGSHAPDGIVGPYHEKEASFFTIKDVWSPIKFEHREITSRFDGVFTVENRYFYTNLNSCSFTYKLKSIGKPGIFSDDSEITGTFSNVNILPGGKGKIEMKLPADWQNFDIMYLEAFDSDNKLINTWSWPITRPKEFADKNFNISGISKPEINVKDSLWIITTGNATLTISSKTALLKEVETKKGILPFINGPVLCEGNGTPDSVNWHFEKDHLIVSGWFGKSSQFKQLDWVIYPSGIVKLNVAYLPVDYESALLGVSFSFPESIVKNVTWLGNGPYRVWKNRLQGGTLNIWNKDYNNTVTGESQKLIYPEFKGFYSNFYWMKLETNGLPLIVGTETEDVFLRLFTPQPPKETFNTAPAFPTGDISFLQGISAIGTKSQKPENMGPSGKKNMFFDYWRARPKEMSLVFNFSGE